MDIKQIHEKLRQLLHKYRYPILVVLIGLVLLWLPGKSGNQSIQAATQPDRVQEDLNQQLTAILGKIDGVGKVQVLLTVSVGETTVYQSDTDQTDTGIRKETVIITDSGRNQHALITQVLPQRYRGAVIVCQGADSPAVKLAVVEAVSRATGLGADQISVLKMK